MPAENQSTFKDTSMTATRRNWRIMPSQFVEHHTEKIAKEENRSIAKCARCCFAKASVRDWRANRAAAMPKI
jgi:hypothetical protein